ncbi:hypothetical protein [Paracoccus spongiarum]|uniref:Uncharacterized protein n=1 Tax=Paracoccus spongiarum TaxID=3064387 RepID=A0ABT9J9U3_9RHOB|nr:hypothetical protein [Paracoccus sp. 2205BS29-5]MDP5305927.1 hypothetical protein [Paracoccus sp. 2205BS29-5]
MAEGDDHVRMAGWHTPQGLGKALLPSMGVRDDDGFADDPG